MTTVASVESVEAAPPRAVRSRDIRIALLGLGQVGSAIAALAAETRASGAAITIASALVRDRHRPRPIDTSAIPLTTDPSAVLASKADVVVEVLGGLEPARSLVLAALRAGTPVVTANKTLLAVHGEELFDAARRTGTSLLYEASVLAGVPFLTMFSRRPRANAITGFSGIVNGTSNFILSRMASHRDGFANALAAAQQAGYAEPDPSKDLDGDDAVEKLCVLLRHFGGWRIAPAEIERTGIRAIEAADLEQAAAFGGVIRPIASADWCNGRLTAHVGPAFVAASHPLSRVGGVQNGLSLRTRDSGELFFSGPGAGPHVTASTVLDDVVEIRHAAGAIHHVEPRAPEPCGTPDTAWFLRLTSNDFPDTQHAPAVFSRLGIRTRRVSAFRAGDGGIRQWLLTSACARSHVDAVIDVLSSKTRCEALCFRVIE
jgi:homoserine dehydrogenase